MASPPRVQDVIDLPDRWTQDGLVEDPDAAEPEDPASSAARVIAAEARSMFLAVDARTSEIEADARRSADEIRRRADAATSPARARLAAWSRELGGLGAELDRALEERSLRRGRGG